MIAVDITEWMKALRMLISAPEPPIAMLSSAVIMPSTRPKLASVGLCGRKSVERVEQVARVDERGLHDHPHRQQGHGDHADQGGPGQQAAGRPVAARADAEAGNGGGLAHGGFP